MDPYSNSLNHHLIVTAGIIIESIRHVDIVKKPLLWMGVLLLSLFAFVPNKHEYIYDMPSHILQYGAYYVFILFFFFQRDVVPKMTEFHIIFQTVAASVATELLIPESLPPEARVGFHLMCAGAVILAIIPKTLPDAVQIGLFLWSILMSTLILFSQYSRFLAYPFADPLSVHSIIYMLSSGAVGYILLRNLTMLFYAIPLPAKHQRMDDRINQLIEYLTLLHEKYEHTQVLPWVALIIVLVMIELVVINQYFSFVRPEFLINAILISGSLIGTTPLLYMRKPPDPPERIVSMRIEDSKA